MMQKNGDVMTKVVDNFKRTTPHPMTEANFEKQSEIQSDESHPYKRLSQKTIPKHKSIDTLKPFPSIQ